MMHRTTEWLTGRYAILLISAGATMILAAGCGDGGTSGDDPLALDDGASLTFAVEVIVTDAPAGELSAGDVLWERSCYTLWSDGTFSDPAFPDWDGWVTGTWENGWDGTNSSYIGRTSESANLVQMGSITVDATTGALHLTADTTISIAGAMLAELRSVGQEVETCTPVAG